jgi:guanylate kinase
MGDTSHNSADQLHRRGLMFILSSPSGGGKTTIARKLLEADPAIALSISATTRPPRPGEVDGVHYHFVSDATFDRMVEEDEFYEWANVFGYRYGTPKGIIRAALKEGQDFLFDIDWQGTQQLFQKDQQDVVRVFLLPPSLVELEKRLRSRGTDSDEVIATRLAKARTEISHSLPTGTLDEYASTKLARAKAEISHWDGYDYVVINDDVDECLLKVRAILEAERMKRQRQTGLIPFVRGLMG